MWRLDKLHEMRNARCSLGPTEVCPHLDGGLFDGVWSVPPDQPDLVPAQEALVLNEGLREAGRSLAADSDARFKTWLAESEALATRLEAAVRRQDRDDATACLQRLDASCKGCHEAYRN